MKTKLKLIALGHLLAAICFAASAQGTAFIYQGRLNVGPDPATGVFDLKFSVYDSTSGGSLVGQPLTNALTGVTNGLFNTPLDFGAGAFNGNPRWLEIGVRSNGSASAYAPLTPRQPISPAPYAIYSGNSASLNGQAATDFAPVSGSTAYVAKTGDTMTGPLTLAANGLVAGANQLVLSGGNVGIGTAAPTAKLDIAGTVKATSFQGDGSGLIGVSVSGAAGGDLAGTYPNPTIASGAVTGAKIAAGQVVKSLNSLHDAVSITAGANVTITTVGNAVQVASTSGATLTSLGIKSGTVSGASDANFFLVSNVTFGAAYPNANYSILVTAKRPASPGAPPNGSYTNKTATGFTLILNNSGPSGATLSGDWMTAPYNN